MISYIISYLSGLMNIQSTQNIPHCTHDIPHTRRYIMMNMGYSMMLVVGWHEYVGGSVQRGFHIKLMNEYKSTIFPAFFHDII